MITLEYYSPQYLERKLDNILEKRKKGINLLIKQRLIDDAPELLKRVSVKVNTVLYGDGVISRYKLKYRFNGCLLVIKIDEDMQVSFSLTENGDAILKKGFFEKDIKIFKKVDPIVICYLTSKTWYEIIKRLEKSEKNEWILRNK